MAFLRADYDVAVNLYSEALTQKPGDPGLTAGLVEVLLHQQKVAEANNVVTKALSANSKSAVLQTALGFVQFRAGTPWLAADSAARATSLDPCYARARLLNVRILRLNSLYKSAADELKTAHSLDPYDPAIRGAWIQTLPLEERIKAAEDFLNSSNGADAEEQKRLRLYLDDLKKLASQSGKSCRLASTESTTELPFARIMLDGAHVRAYGLDVKLNNHNARLEVDTGAGGVLISRSVAKQAGLEEFSATEVGGIGVGGEKPAYTAYVDTIKIGSLEFHDCAVTVFDSRDVVGVDGLIGMNVFSNFLVTLDYPMRRILLGPLPPRPHDAASVKPSLATNADENSAVENSGSDGKQATPAHGAAIEPQDRYIAPEMADWTKVYRVGHQLLIPAALNQSVLKLFILDTGAFSTTVSPEAAREVTKVHSNYDMTVRGLSGKVNKVYSTGEMTFDFANLRQPASGVVAFDMSAISKHTGLEVSGFIGITTLGQLRVKIDYRDALVKFDYDPRRGYRSLY
ncbi:MAG: aspartyl protease family protein [Acidobacteriaceae bacterium]|nr:aspartyl protease family protein [Acidobacteriaceae bacterium]MBV8570912.1 aspartyl protease family protein [Acidobacteriaceae bacterium]